MLIFFFFVQREAVSTSHFSQPNTIEYDMSMEWCTQQEKTDLLWKSLYKVLIMLPTSPNLMMNWNMYIVLINVTLLHVFSHAKLNISLPLFL